MYCFLAHWLPCPRETDSGAHAVNVRASSGQPVPWTQPCQRVLRRRFRAGGPIAFFKTVCLNIVSPRSYPLASLIGHCPLVAFLCPFSKILFIESSSLTHAIRTTCWLNHPGVIHVRDRVLLFSSSLFLPKLSQFSSSVSSLSWPRADGAADGPSHLLTLANQWAANSR